MSKQGEDGGAKVEAWMVPLIKLQNYLQAHADVIDASWTAKVIEEAKEAFAACAPAPTPALPKDAIAALRQWESDTEKPATATEGNAFIDGFHAGRVATPAPSESADGGTKR